MFESQMSTRPRRIVAPITVYTNGNKYDAKRVIYNPKYVRSFDALLDQLTLETNATCAVRRIYTPHGSRQVGNLSAIQPGGMYVAVSQGRFKKMPYGKTHSDSSSPSTVTTKIHRRKPAHSRLQESYEDEMKMQKTIYVHRNGSNEHPTQIFFTKKLLRTMSQVLDIVQEKIACERAIVSLRKLNGLTITDVTKLQPEGRYVAVEQGQRFRRITYDHVDDGSSSPRKHKLPLIINNGNNTWRSTSAGKPHRRLPSNESNQEQTSQRKARLKLPAIKQNIQEPQGFQVTYGYPKKETQDMSYRSPKEERHNIMQPIHYNGGVFYATGKEREKGTQIHDDRRVKVDKPLDMTEAQEVEEMLDGAGIHGNNRHARRDHHAKRSRPPEVEKQRSVKLPDIVHVPKPPTKPSIVHPRRHKYEKQQRGGKNAVPKGLVHDQRFVSQDNSMANTKQYIVTREQRLLVMHGHDDREPVNNVVHALTENTLAKDREQKRHEQEKQKRIEQWVDHTVDEKQKEDEIVAVAKHLVFNAIVKAGGQPEVEKESVGKNGINVNYGKPTRKKNGPSFCDEKKTNGIKYHRVFGT